MTLIGLGLARLTLPRLLASRLARWRPRWAAARGLAFAGRHSLAVYLIHQPALFALLYAGTQWTGVSARQASDHYLAACRPACVEAGGEIEACARACACVVEKASDGGLIASLTSRNPSETDRGRISGIVNACGSDAK